MESMKTVVTAEAPDTWRETGKPFETPIHIVVTPNPFKFVCVSPSGLGAHALLRFHPVPPYTGVREIEGRSDSVLYEDFLRWYPEMVLMD